MKGEVGMKNTTLTLTFNTERLDALTYHMGKKEADRSSVDTAPFIAPTVPTFMKTGVWTVPWTVFISARFARPSL